MNKYLNIITIILALVVSLSFANDDETWEMVWQGPVQPNQCLHSDAEDPKYYLFPVCEFIKKAIGRDIILSDNIFTSDQYEVKSWERDKIVLDRIDTVEDVNLPTAGEIIFHLIPDKVDRLNKFVIDFSSNISANIQTSSVIEQTTILSILFAEQIDLPFGYIKITQEADNVIVYYIASIEGGFCNGGEGCSFSTQ